MLNFIFFPVEIAVNICNTNIIIKVNMQIYSARSWRLWKIRIIAITKTTLLQAVLEDNMKRYHLNTNN